MGGGGHGHPEAFGAAEIEVFEGAGKERLKTRVDLRMVW